MASDSDRQRLLHTFMETFLRLPTQRLVGYTFPKWIVSSFKSQTFCTIDVCGRGLYTVVAV